MSSNIITNSDYAINLNSGANTLSLTGVFSATGNIAGNFFIGNGSQLTGITAASSYGNSNVVANLAALGTNPVSTTGNISSSLFIGNGSQLTGLAATYGNSNVVANVAALGTNPVSTTGNITGGNVLTGGLISATGNITGGNVLGGANVNATTHTGTTVSVSANVTGGNLLTGGLISATSTITSAANITGGNLLTIGLISATGNITGNVFIGNGSQLTGIATSYGNSNVVANVAALGSNPVSTTGNITSGNLLTGGLVSATGNITGGNVLGGANVNATTHTGTTVSVSANVTGGNILTGGLVSVTGNITGGNLTIAGNTATITTASYSIGYLNVPQVSLAANATTALTDSGKHYYSTSASNLTLTVADNSAVSWPVGTSFIVVNRGTGNITVAPAAGVSLYLAGNSTSASRVLTTYNLATCLNLAANVWMISGSGLV